MAVVPLQEAAILVPSGRPPEGRRKNTRSNARKVDCQIRSVRTIFLCSL